MKFSAKLKAITGFAIVAAAISGTAVQAHHSFAMYNVKKTIVYTGVVTRIDPQPNHLQVFFAPMNEERTNVLRNEEGEPLTWGVEMQGSAQMARQGLSVNSFPRGTVFSVGLHPLRNGDSSGVRVGGLYKCPERTPPEPGMHCDTVEGSLHIGRDTLAAEEDR